MPLDEARPEAPYAKERFTSYSLNFEDVILHRLFAHRAPGFYVDVGAGHPRFENDTYALYEAGWSGINVEPNPEFFRRLEQERPRDRNLCLALSDRAEESLTYYEVPGTGLSTCDPVMAQAHEARGHEVQVRSVPVSTLAEVLEEAGIVSVDVLKVDVEGFEERVLAGNDWDRISPAVILVEATYPERPERRPTGIGQFLQSRGYRHAYFDGLNDFYLRDDFDEGTAFKLPPNVFDGFVLREVMDLRQTVKAVEAEFRSAERYAKSLEVTREAENAAASTSQEHLILDRDKLREQLISTQEYAKSLEAALQTERAARADSRVRQLRLRHDAVALEGWLVRILKGGPADLKRVTQDIRTWFSTRLGGEDEMDMTIEGEAREAGDLVLAERLACAYSEGLRDENRRLERDMVDLRLENRRLRAATEQMRAEIVSLHRALEPMHWLHEQVANLEAREARLQLEARTERERAAHLGAYVHALYNSTSWKFARPVRGIGRLLRGEKRKP